MTFKPRLELKVATKLALTYQLQQAIQLLQMSHLELADYIRNELDQNPFLDRDEFGEVSNQEPNQDNSEQEKEILDIKDNDLDTDYENVWQDDNSPHEGGAKSEAHDYEPSYSSSKKSAALDQDSNFLEQMVGEDISLRENLERQMCLEIESPKERLIARTLIDAIDESGYLIEPLSTFAEKLGCPKDEIKRILKILQKLEPAGVFARNLAECLALQLREREMLTPIFQKVLENLDLIGERNFQKLAKLCDTDLEEIIKITRIIQTLNPKPGLIYEHSHIETIIPDIFLKQTQEGEYILELNSETMPKLLVNQKYYSKLCVENENKQSKKYITEKMTHANWLIQALEQRATSILKIATEIVSQQRQFFDKGISHLKPMILSDISEKLSIHESTVSRASISKYMATPRGLFELKYFFSSSLHSSDHESTFSSKSVQHILQRLIAEEKSGQVLSDEAIVKKMKEMNIEIARRTVVKYRDKLGIPPSNKRKKIKQNLSYLPNNGKTDSHSELNSQK